MVHYSAQPLQVNLLTSWRLALLMAIASISTIVILLLMPLLILLKLFISSVIVIMAVYHIWRDALLRFPWSWAAIQVHSTGELSLIQQDGSAHQVTIEPSCVVLSSLMILHVKLPSSRWPAYVVLLPDSAEQASLRKLRIWLRWGMPEALDKAQDVQGDA